jgi:phosphatidate cytidylyltransferase
MLSRRLATTGVFLPFLLIGLLTDTPGKIVIALVVAGCSVWGLKEFFNLAARVGACPPRQWILFIAVVSPLLILTCRLAHVPYRWILLWGAVGVLGTLWFLVRAGRIEKAWDDFMASIVALIYIPLPLCLGQLLLQAEHGAWLLFFVILVTWLNDTGAFFTGKLLGRHKLCPTISPGKTWEGLIGGITLALLGIVAVGIVQGFAHSQGVDTLSHFWTSGTAMDRIRLLLLGVVLIIAGTLGDLAESMLKRGLGVKDSGSGLTGHGGFLDITDSLLVNLPLMLIYVLLFEDLRVWV